MVQNRKRGHEAEESPGLKGKKAKKYDDKKSAKSQDGSEVVPVRADPQPLLIVDRLTGPAAFHAHHDLANQEHKGDDSEDSIDLVAEFFSGGGQASHLLHLLETRDEKVKSVEVCAVFSSSEAVISRVARAQPQPELSFGGRGMTVAMELTKRILDDYSKELVLLLSGQNTEAQAKSVLRLLTSMVTLDPQAARMVILKVNLESTNWETLSKRVSSKDPPDVRTCFIRFLLSFFLDGHPICIKECVERNTRLPSILPGLMQDKPEIVQVVIETFRQKMLLNTSVSRTLKMRLFGSGNIRHILALRNWRGPSDIAEFDEERLRDLADIRASVHEFCRVLLTSTKHGVVFNDYPELGADGKTTNPLIAQVLKDFAKSMWDSEDLSQLSTDIVVGTPSLLPVVLEVMQGEWQPTMDSMTWLKPVQFLVFLLAKLPADRIAANIGCKNKILLHTLRNILMPFKILEQVVTPGLTLAATEAGFAIEQPQLRLVLEVVSSLVANTEAFLGRLRVREEEEGHKGTSLNALNKELKYLVREKYPTLETLEILWQKLIDSCIINEATIRAATCLLRAIRFRCMHSSSAASQQATANHSPESMPAATNSNLAPIAVQFFEGAERLRQLWAASAAGLEEKNAGKSGSTTDQLHMEALLLVTGVLNKRDVDSRERGQDGLRPVSAAPLAPFIREAVSEDTFAVLLANILDCADQPTRSCDHPEDQEESGKSEINSRMREISLEILKSILTQTNVILEDETDLNLVLGIADGKSVIKEVAKTLFTALKNVHSYMEEIESFEASQARISSKSMNQLFEHLMNDTPEEELPQEWLVKGQKIQISPFLLALLEDVHVEGRGTESAKKAKKSKKKKAQVESDADVSSCENVMLGVVETTLHAILLLQSDPKPLCEVLLQKVDNNPVFPEHFVNKLRGLTSDKAVWPHSGLADSLDDLTRLSATAAKSNKSLSRAFLAHLLQVASAKVDQSSMNKDDIHLEHVMTFYREGPESSTSPSEVALSALTSFLADLAPLDKLRGLQACLKSHNLVANTRPFGLEVNGAPAPTPATRVADVIVPVLLDFGAKAKISFYKLTGHDDPGSPLPFFLSTKHVKPLIDDDKTGHNLGKDGGDVPLSERRAAIILRMFEHASRDFATTAGGGKDTEATGRQRLAELIESLVQMSPNRFLVIGEKDRDSVKLGARGILLTGLLTMLGGADRKALSILTSATWGRLSTVVEYLINRLPSTTSSETVSSSDDSLASSVDAGRLIECLTRIIKLWRSGGPDEAAPHLAMHPDGVVSENLLYLCMDRLHRSDVRQLVISLVTQYPKMCHCFTEFVQRHKDQFLQKTASWTPAMYILEVIKMLLSFENAQPTSAPIIAKHQKLTGDSIRADKSIQEYLSRLRLSLNAFDANKAILGDKKLVRLVTKAVLNHLVMETDCQLPETNEVLGKLADNLSLTNGILSAVCPAIVLSGAAKASGILDALNSEETEKGENGIWQKINAKCEPTGNDDRGRKREIKLAYLELRHHLLATPLQVPAEGADEGSKKSQKKQLVEEVLGPLMDLLAVELKEAVGASEKSSSIVSDSESQNKDTNQEAKVQSLWHFVSRVCTLFNKVLATLDAKVISRKLSKNLAGKWSGLVKSVLKHSLRLRTSLFIGTGSECVRLLAKTCRKRYRPDKLETEDMNEMQLINDMLASHSGYLPVIMGGDSELKVAVLELLAALLPISLKQDQIPVLLSGYFATLSPSDQQILSLLHKAEQNEVDLSMYRPIVFGEAAVKQYTSYNKVKKEGDAGNPFRMKKNSEVLGLLDQDKMTRTALNFPLHLALVPADDQQVDPTEEPHKRDQSIGDQEQNLYDPRFILPLLSSATSEDVYIDKHLKVIECGGLSLAIAALSSHQTCMRTAGYHILHRFYQRMSEAKFAAEKQIWLHLVDLIRNGLAAASQTKTCLRIPSVSTVFLVLAIKIITKPLHPLYRQISDFLLAKPSLELYKVPELLRLLHGKDVTLAKQQQAWLLNLLREGLKDRLDQQIYSQSYVYKLVLSQWGSCLGDRQYLNLVLDLVERALSVRGSCFDLLQKHGIIQWMAASMRCIASTSSSQLTPAEKRKLVDRQMDAILVAVDTVLAAAQAERRKFETEKDILSPYSERLRGLVRLFYSGLVMLSAVMDLVVRNCNKEDSSIAATNSEISERNAVDKDDRTDAIATVNENLMMKPRITVPPSLTRLQPALDSFQIILNS